MITMYKILRGMVTIDTSKLFTLADTASGHDLKVVRKHATRLARKNA